MDKYYLTKLAYMAKLLAGEQSAKLVEIQYSRQPPSLGIIHLTDESQQNKDRLSASRRSLALNLIGLELRGEKNAAQFSTLKKLKLNDQEMPDVADFDTSKAVEVDAPIIESLPHCVILAADSSLFATHLSVGETKLQRLTSACNQAQLLRQGLPLQCKFHPQTAVGRSLVQLLHEKRYSLYELSPKQPLKLIYEYLLSDFDSKKQEVSLLRFKQFHAVEVSPSVVILELSDLSLRVLQRDNQLANFRLDEEYVTPHLSRRSLVLSSGSVTDEFLLISLSQFKLTAHSLHVIDDEKASKLQDPDNLLEREPSFELDRCWSVDLNDIDSIRSLGEDQGPAGAAICPMWSANQLNVDECWPQFLIVAIGSHLLVYSFAQQPSLPFSVVYDRSFLKIAPLNEDSQREHLDVRMRPKLLHNFKLTGSQRADSLFNNRFTSQRTSFSTCRHFNQLGLLVGLTSAADVIAFRFTSPKVAPQRYNVYQQLIGEAIKGDSLLVHLGKKLHEENSLLLADIESIEDSDAGRSKYDLDTLLSADLKPRQQMCCMYDLVLSTSDLVQISRLIVFSTATSFILEPTAGYHASSSTYIYNRGSEVTTEESEKAFVLSNINLEDQTICIEELLGKDHPKGETIRSWAIIELDIRKGCNLSLPIFLMTGLSGHLRIFFQLEGQPIRSYSKTLQVKPLMSYQPVSTIESNNPQTTIQVRGTFGEQLVLGWLSECLDIRELGKEGKFWSAFTRCSFEFHLTENQATISSDDLIAIEQVKKHLLKRATEVSLKLEVTQPTPSTSNLHHLIELQHSQCEIAIKRMKSLSRSQEMKTNERVEALLECLSSEVPDPEEGLLETFREDLERLLGEGTQT